VSSFQESINREMDQKAKDKANDLSTKLTVQIEKTRQLDPERSAIDIALNFLLTELARTQVAVTEAIEGVASAHGGLHDINVSVGKLTEAVRRAL
jgi:phage-related minor tail protein